VSGSSSPRLDAARSWVRHLRTGGSTGWQAWLSDPRPGTPAADGADADGADDERLPGAAQAELVRRLAECWSGDGNLDFGALADRVLHRSTPGRGLGDLPLVADGGASHGPVAVDPEAVPEEELLRICVGVLADLLTEADPPAGPGRAEAPRRRPWHPAFRLVGAPLDVAVLRASLAARGLVEGGRRPRVLVAARDLDTAMRQVWTAAAHGGAEMRWRRIWARARTRDALPARADIPRVAARWAGEVGSHRVHLLVARDTAALHDAAASALGLPRLPVRADSSVVPPYPPEAVDLLRRLNAVLGVRLEPDRAQHLREQVLPALLGTPDGALRAPRRYRRWARQRAAAVPERLAAGGYAVHGNLGDLVPGDARDVPGNPVRGCVLDTALRACLRAAQEQAQVQG
jgi:hypothetical protein